MIKTKDETGTECHKLEEQDYKNAGNKCCGCINWCDGNCYSYVRYGKCEYKENPYAWTPQ